MKLVVRTGGATGDIVSIRHALLTRSYSTSVVFVVPHIDPFLSCVSFFSDRLRSELRVLRHDSLGPICASMTLEGPQDNVRRSCLRAHRSIRFECRTIPTESTE